MARTSADPDAYKKVQALLKKEPELSVAAACKKLKIPESTYDYQRSKHKVKTAAKKPRQRAAKVPVVPTQKIMLPSHNSGQLIVLMGSPDQIREVLQ